MNTNQFPTFDPGPTVDGTGIEIRTAGLPKGTIRSALFDFDGTVSLIRSGWQDVMVPMMVEILAEHGTGESERELERRVRGFVDRLTGKQTVFQMIRLADEVRELGGTPLDPLDYKRLYLDRLMDRIRSRREGLRSGSTDPDDLLMPNTRHLLEELVRREITLYLASGTDLIYVDEEAALLDVHKYFDGGVHAALDRVEDFSKAKVIQQIFQEHGLSGPQLVSFGDGYVEILNTKEAGGVAIGVASDEVGRHDVDEWKRNRLIQAGADIIIPGYDDADFLLALLFDGDPI